jgi:hypothetical protein
MCSGTTFYYQNNFIYTFWKVDLLGVWGSTAPGLSCFIGLQILEDEVAQLLLHHDKDLLVSVKWHPKKHIKSLPYYGTAASAHPRRYGEFKIDLRGTGLAVSKEVGFPRTRMICTILN